MTRPRRAWAALVAALLAGGAALAAQGGMPNPKDMSGMVLPVAEIPAGTVSVRVLRGGFDQVVTDHPVEFQIDGKSRTVKTDAEGRATVSGLPRGSRLRAVTVVDGERLESQEAIVADSGLRMMLVATDRTAPAAAASPGAVLIGPGSRVIAEMQNDQLTVFYQLQIVNPSQTPVDIGGPLVFELPREARGATVLEGSSPLATANGPRVTILGPFAPGMTPVEAAYELPYSGSTARIDQTMPADWPQVAVVVQQLGGWKVSSPQLTSQQEVSGDGRPMIVGTGPGLTAGQQLTLQISGLPNRPAWPRNLALALAAIIIVAGLWGAFSAAPRRVSA